MRVPMAWFTALCVVTLTFTLHPTPAAAMEQPQQQQIGAPSQSVALALYGQLRTTQAGNLFFSPFSIAEALSMTQLGARGQTATQLHALLGADPAAYGAWARQVNGPHPDFELHTANAMWVQNGSPFRAEFLTSAKDDFGAQPRLADFQRAAAAAIKEINEWIAHETNGKITDLLGPRSLDANTRLVLANAIYFKGQWLHTFAHGATSTQPFHAAGGKDISTPMMHQTQSFPLYQDDALQMLELPYKGSELSMLVLLPRKVDGLDDLERSLTVDKLTTWSKAAESQRTKVELPKFTIKQTLGLVPTLQALGVRDLFEGGVADLSGIDGTRQLYVSAVAHGAFVKVDEEGTEAAAATAVAVGAMAVRPVEVQTFRADHPFLFLIRHNPTGGVLFLGRLTEPTEK